MEPVGGISADLRPPWWWLAALALLASIGLCGWAWWFSGQGGEVPFGWTALPVALVFVATLAAAAALHTRSQEQSRQLAEALRDARGRLHCVEELLDVWQWRTDAEHRLVEVRPPRGAEAAEWRDAGRVTLWEFFKAADEPALRAQLTSFAPFDDMQVMRSDAAAGAGRGQLRGRPRVDALGGFAGYQGVMREFDPGMRAASPGSSGAAVATAPEAAGMPQATADSSTEHESFSYTVSHDLRAPIRVVEGFTKIIKEDYGRLLDRVGNDHLDRVLGAAARMNNMIDALLALSKLASQPLARQPVNLSQLASYVADDLRRQWPDRAVTLVVEPGMQLHGDPTLLRVVLENLLGNAWKYTGKSTQAQVWFERNPQAGDTFTVRDNGAGFDMRFADRLFGVFQRLHSANDFPGTGIGLASVRRIVRRHGGEIWGEAEVNRGARFHFSLPQR